MKQLYLFKEADKRGVHPQERLATTCVVNPAYSEVTSYMEPGGARYWAVMQVKGLSPEITIVLDADAVHLAEGSILNTDIRRGVRKPTGSETTARYQRDRVGTRETQGVLRKGVCNNKPIDGKLLQKTLWESDQLIVAKKSRNGDGAKGLAVVMRESGETSSAHRGGHRKSTELLSRLTIRASENPRCKFTSLAHLLNVEFLEECFRELKRNKAEGVDGVTVEEYEEGLEENLKDLVSRLKAKRYRPKPVKRVYIPKIRGGKRPLGIPAVEDKIVQIGLKKILEAIYEVDFLDVSYGFRPKRSCHQALDVLDKAIMTRPVNWIVDMDIEKFFDTVDHKWLMKFLKERIADPNILRLIGRFLRAGVMEEGRYYKVDRGTPQGGILSPLLANIYLHYCLDLWFERAIKKKLRGYGEMVRYADDFVVCFQYEREARGFGKALRQRLEKFGLRISEEKSRIIPFGRNMYYRAQGRGEKIPTFEFLGFTHYCTRTRRGYFKLGRKTSKAKFRQRVKEMNQWLKGIRNWLKVEEWWEILRMKLLGHYHYYGISGNIKEIKAYYREVIRLAYKWINRRSQKRSYNWAQFQRFLQYNPLPKPKIYHSTYTLSPKEGYTIEEPCAGNLQARFCEGH